MQDTTKIELLYRCKRIRCVEEEIANRYSEQEMRCPTHLSIGQELTGAAAGMILRQDDPAVSTHRAHAHYLGKGGDMGAMIAEIYGKETGCAKGRGGSMHLTDLSAGFVASTAIVGNTIPVGVGLAHSIKLDKDDRIACVFLGDAAVETGVFYESVNFAAVQKLPLLILCENNLYSVYSPLSVRQPKGRKIHEMVRATGLETGHVHGMEAVDTFNAISSMASYVRNGNGPALLEIDTYRWREHCGMNYDNDIGYRTEEEYLSWYEKDPQHRLEKELLKEGLLTSNALEEMNQSIANEIDTAFTQAKNAPFPTPETAGDFEYSDMGGQP
ncbi:MAG: thiamine pyrophosphate-dependent dehydrogenase E1 component subunit alpha [Methyloligellaceae bacterium]